MILRALKRGPHWLRQRNLRALRRPLPWLIALAVAGLLLGVGLLGRLVLSIATPTTVRYVGELAGRSMADYSSWALGPLIPPINPEAIEAAESEPEPPAGPGAPQGAVPIAVVGAATPSPAAPPPTSTPEATPSPTSTPEATPSPTSTPEATPSPTATATRTAAPIQAPTAPPTSTGAPTATAAAPSSTPVRAPEIPPAPPTRPPAPPTATPLPTASPRPTDPPLPTTQPPAPSPPAPSPPPPSPVPPTATPEPTPAVELASGAITVGENDGAARVLVRLSARYSQGVEVRYAIEQGTAKAAADFVAAPAEGTLVFGRDVTEQTISVPIVRDGLDELSETFTVRLLDPKNATLSGVSLAVVTIVDGDGPPAVSFAGDGRTIAEGNGQSQSVALTFQLSAPSALDVAVSYEVRGSAGPGDHSLRAGTALIRAGTSSTRLRFDVEGDRIDEDTEQIEVRVVAASNAQLALPSTYTVTVVDDDTAGVTVRPLQLSAGEAPGSAAASYQVVLESQPVADVTVAVTSPDGQLLAGPATLAFTPQSWDQPQSVSVRAVDDKIDEPDQHQGRLTHSTSSTDPRYNGLTDIDPVTATIADDDRAGVEVLPGDLRVAISESPAEPDHSATYTLRLTSEPTASVRIDLAADGQVAVSPAALEFSAANWNSAQTVTVTAVDDRVDEDGDGNLSRHRGVVRHTTFSSDPNYGAGRAFTIPDLLAQIRDDDTARVITPSSLAVTEGETITYTVRLDSEPVADVRVTLATTSTTISISPAALSFDRLNWSRPQTVTVTARENFVDAEIPAALISYGVTSGDRGYSNLATPATSVSISDDDTAGVMIAPPLLELSEWVTATNHTGTYSVTLTSQPTATVQIRLDGVGPCGDSGAGVQLCADKEVLVFEPANWRSAQPVRLTAVDDPDDEPSPHDGQVAHRVSSADPNYADGTLPFATPRVSVSIEDNDAAGIVLAQLPATVNEGGTVAYTARLATRPRGPVTVRIAVAPAGVAVVSPPTLTFTPATWHTPQTVTLGVPQDDTDEPDARATITHTADSADGTYNGRTAAPAITISDDDTAGILVSPQRLALSEAPAAPNRSGTYTVALTSQPIAPVQIALIPDAQVTVSPAVLEFDRLSWRQPRVVTVTAVDDALDEASPHVGAVTNRAVSVDPSYGGRQVDLTLDIADNDTAGVQIAAPTATTVTEGEVISYTVRLTSQPRSPVTVSMAAAPASLVTFSAPSLSFTAQNWSVPQVVDITAVENAVDEPAPSPTVTVSHQVSSADGDYNLLPAGSIVLTVRDDDTAGVLLSAASLSVSELATAPERSAAYTIRLSSEPTAPVTITLAFDGAQIAATPAALVFTPATWAISQTVAVSAVDDLVLEGAQALLIAHSITSPDATYRSLTAAPVAVSVGDDDQAGLEVSPPALRLVESATDGQTTAATFELRLRSRPASPVTVALDADGQLQVSPTTVTFTPGTWDTPQTITLSAVDDVIAEAGVHTSSVAFSLSSADLYYQARDVPPYLVEIVDDDQAGLMVPVPAGDSTGKGGGTVAFTVRLAGQPGRLVSRGLRGAQRHAPDRARADRRHGQRVAAGRHGLRARRAARGAAHRGAGPGRARQQQAGGLLRIR